ncbi:MAG: hypothetical protein O2960_15030 [Verrucomicrobia bacterium]|nr:hypothetical protein [Verrucomicrobiota bacterium]
MTATVGNQGFQKGEDFNGGQVRVKLSGDSEKPVVDALSSTRRTSEQVAKKWRKFASHAAVLS